MKKRKYFRSKINRIPPYSGINGSYFYEIDVWAFSKEGANNKLKRLYKDCCGRHIIEDAVEISKEEFRGDQAIMDIKTA